MAEQILRRPSLLGRALGKNNTEAGTPRVRFPIVVKIVLPYMLLALAVALSAAFVITRIVQDTIEERFANQLVESGSLASEWMVREENRLLETLRLLAFTTGVPEALLDGSAEQLRELSFGITVDHGEEAVAFLDSQGHLILSMRHKKDGRLEDYDFGTGGAPVLADQDFVKKALAAESDDLGNKYSGFVSDDRGGTFYVAGPVFDSQGNRAGVVLVGKTVSRLVEQMRQATLAQVTLYNMNGDVLASTFFEPKPLPGEKSQEVLGEQDQVSHRRDLGQQPVRNAQVTRDVNVLDHDYTEILGPWEVRGDADLGIFGVSLPWSFVVQTNLPTRFQIAALVSLSMVLIVLMGLILANYITRPLLSLVNASSEVAQGNLQVQVQAQTSDEVEVLAGTFNLMVDNLRSSKQALVKAYETTLKGWARALELRDKETEGHTERVADITYQLAQRFGYSGEELEHVRVGALLHDIGKMGIPDRILLKEGPLTAEERQEMQRHPGIAFDWLSPIEFFQPSIAIPYCHHEKWDGSGYPRGLLGEEIPLPARIFAVVDVWDALSSDRPYRKAWPQEKVMAEIEKGRGSHFDPHVVDVFLEFHGMIPQTGHEDEA